MNRSAASSAYPATAETRRYSAWVWLFPILSTVLAAAAVWLHFPNMHALSRYHPRPDYTFDFLQLVIGLLYPILGAFIVQHRRGNRVGWIFCAMGLSSALYLFSTGYSFYSFFARNEALPLAGEVAWLQTYIWFVPINLMVLMVLVYPTGRVISPRWRWVSWVILALAPLMFLVLFIITWQYRGPMLLLPAAVLPPPLVEKQRLTQLLLMPILGLMVFALLPLSVASLILRLRRAGGAERLQIEWFLFTGSIFAVFLILDLLASLLFPNHDWVNQFLWNGILPLLAAAMAIAVAFAILCHRLFDIDLIIRRTLAYTALTAILALIYLVSVISLQAVLRQVIGSNSPVAIVISTLLIAALFTPLRLRVQAMINRRFYRARYSVERALSEFNATTQTQVDVDQISSELLGIIDEAVRPNEISLWLLKKE